MSTQDPPQPSGRGKRWWNSLTPEERKLHTYWRFFAKHRNVEIMSALGLSVGTVAGMKRRWVESGSPENALSETQAGTVDLPQKPARITGINPEHPPSEKRKFTTVESQLCDYVGPDDNRRCALLWQVRVGKKKFCVTHQNCGQ